MSIFIITTEQGDEIRRVEAKTLLEARYAYLISEHTNRPVRITSDLRIIRFSDGETQHIHTT